MLIVLRRDATPEEIERVRHEVRRRGWTPHTVAAASRTAVVITGNPGGLDAAPFRDLPGVIDARPVTEAYKLVSREVRPDDSVVDVCGARVGGREVHVMAGPCAVESREQILATAAAVKRAGATFLRGGAFKPRSSPYDFQGLREDGLALLAEARAATGLRIVTECRDVATLPAVAAVADVIQIGARNMQNVALLEAVGALRKPVLLKRAMSATLRELLMAAEYVLSRGNPDVMLCERGIRTFEPATRNTLDLNAVPMLKAMTHLPVVVDPSHGVGVRRAVPAMARAALAAGADALLLEVHHDPPNALSDGFQSLDPDEFAATMAQLRALAPCIGRALATGGT
jgi:3-deoxy-7-phosphoheptulonate synthase